MSATFLREKLVVTRKPHRCWGCRKLLPRATVCLASTNVADGEAYTIYVCRECNEYEKSEEFRKLFKERGYDFEEFLEGDIGILRKGVEL
jgi:hypothetical protein